MIFLLTNPINLGFSSVHSTPTKTLKYRKDTIDTGSVDINASMWDGATALFLAAQVEINMSR